MEEKCLKAEEIKGERDSLYPILCKKNAPPKNEVLFSK